MPRLSSVHPMSYDTSAGAIGNRLFDAGEGVCRRNLCVGSAFVFTSTSCQGRGTR